MNKEELRKIYKQKRADLKPSEIAAYQENIYKQIYKIDLTNIENVHLFLSMRKFKEIDTAPLITYFRAKNKQIIVSKCNFKNHTLSHFNLQKETLLELNKFGVPEPVNAIEVKESVLDLIFVPMLISDLQKYRVGYGKGYYDRFLSNCRKDARRIGINFFKPIKQIADINEFDISLDTVIYPQ